MSLFQKKKFSPKPEINQGKPGSSGFGFTKISVEGLENEKKADSSDLNSEISEFIANDDNDMDSLLNKIASKVKRKPKPPVSRCGCW